MLEARKLLVLSNFYPPHNIGGYEIGLASAVNTLWMEGFRIAAITSFHRVRKRKGHFAYPVYRCLDARPIRGGYLFQMVKAAVREYYNRTIVYAMLKLMQPDAVIIGNIRNLNISLLQSIESLRIPMIFDISDYWLLEYAKQEDWNRVCLGDASARLGSKVTRHFLRMVGKSTGLSVSFYQPKPSYAYFRSEFLKRSYTKEYPDLEVCPVVYHGVDVASYGGKGRSQASEVRKILFVGRVTESKGVHVLLEAFSAIVTSTPLHLTIAGNLMDQSYVKMLQHEIKKLGLLKTVEFVGDIERDVLRGYYLSHDILVFPSVWEEPFPITLIEAMATGIPVIASNSGGVPELALDKKNALVYNKDDAKDLASAIEYAMNGPDRMFAMSINALREVKKFDSSIVNRRITDYICSIVSDR